MTWEVSGGMPAALMATLTASKSLGSVRNLPVLALVGEILGTGFEYDLGELLLVRSCLGNGDDALRGEHPRDRTLGSEVAAVLRKGMTDLADGAILVVGQHFDE